MFISCCCEDFSSVWSDFLVNSVKIEDDGDATDFENEDDFETLFNFYTISCVHVFILILE